MTTLSRKKVHLLIAIHIAHRALHLRLVLSGFTKEKEKGEKKEEYSNHLVSRQLTM